MAFDERAQLRADNLHECEARDLLGAVASIRSVLVLVVPIVQERFDIVPTHRASLTNRGSATVILYLSMRDMPPSLRIIFLNEGTQTLTIDPIGVRRGGRASSEGVLAHR